MHDWIRRKLGGEEPDTIEDNDRLGRFWMRGEIPVVATDIIPASSEMLWLYNDQPHHAAGLYKDVRVVYRTNAHGFRSREIDLASPSRKIMFVGCSHTMGVGMLCLLKTPKSQESMEISAPQPYRHRHAHASVRRRFSALVQGS
jgi:hypothetical protein